MTETLVKNRVINQEQSPTYHFLEGLCETSPGSHVQCSTFLGKRPKIATMAYFFSSS